MGGDWFDPDAYRTGRVTRTTFNTPQYHSAADLARAFESVQPYARESLDHVIVGWPDFHNVITPILWEAWTGAKSVASALAELDERLRGVIADQSARRGR